MNDKQYRRIMRLFTIAWFSVLALLFFLLIMSNKGEARLKDYIDKQIQGVSMSQAKLVDSLPQPKDGYTPIKNIDYFDGRDGKDSFSTVKETRIVEKTIQQVPVNGKDGKTAVFQLNPVTNNLETKYEGDDFWKILIPCEVLKGCKE